MGSALNLGQTGTGFPEHAWSSPTEQIEGASQPYSFGRAAPPQPGATRPICRLRSRFVEVGNSGWVARKIPLGLSAILPSARLFEVPAIAPWEISNPSLR